MVGVMRGARTWATRRYATLLRAGTIGLAMLGITGFVLASGIASADPAPAPRLIEDNVKTCAAAGLSGSVLFGSAPDYPQNPAAGSGTVSGDGQFVDVTINEGFTASGIVVKGGPNTYVYDGPFVGEVTIEDLRSPNNEAGNIPEISHWFVCGMETPPTTAPPTTAPPTTAPPTTAPPTTAPPTTAPPTTAPPTTAPPTTAPPTTAPPTSEPPTVPPTDLPTTPPAETTPPVTPPPPPPPPTLPTTGTRTGLMIGSAVAMIGSGVLLILLMRQRRRFEA